jgi:hypothetical protein
LRASGDHVPGRGTDIVQQPLDAVGVLANVVPVDRGARLAVFAFDQRLQDALEQRDVAVDPYLQEVVGDPGALAEHFQRLLRVHEAQQPRLGQRIDGDDACPGALGELQRGQHARMVGAGVLADGEDELRLGKIVELHGALAEAEHVG